MELFLSCTHLHAENNSPQSAFYTDWFQNGGNIIFSVFILISTL